MKKLATFSAIVLLVGCASTSEMKETVMEKSGGDLESMLSDAKASLKKAGSVGGEWRDSGKMLQQAEAAVKAGDAKKAMKLLQEVKEQGDLGYAQAMAQKDAGPWQFN